MMRKGLSSTALSVFAAGCMVTDHFAAAFIDDAKLYILMRSVGRMAFPIFLFLLTEGIKHTSSKPRYLARLAVFAVVSELPFDLLFYQTGFYPEHQNTLFTLTICAIMLMLLEKYRESPHKAFLSLAMCAAATELLRADGGALAVFLAVFICGSVYSRAAALLAFSVINNISSRNAALTGVYIWNMAALLPIAAYDGRRGGEILPAKMRKWAFYVFYPLHLAALVIIREML